jgi:glycerophosphoryl diester phosphodiesterase
MKSIGVCISILFVSGCSHRVIISHKNMDMKNSVVAHRGAWKKNGLPENSIASLKQAIALKCAGSEFDIRMSADDSLVINHDPDHHGMVIEKTNYAELVTVKLSNGEKLPTLREYLQAGTVNNNSTKLIAEIKPSGISKERAKLIAEKVLKLVNEMQVNERMVYISFDYDILKRIHEIDPGAITQYLEGNKSPDELNADGISGADYHFSVFRNKPEWIASAKKNGLQLNAWTVNNADDMDWLLQNGFDQITTNEPELLFERIKLMSANKD